MLGLLVKFLRLRFSKKVILAEASAGAITAFIMIKVLPYSFWRRWLGKPVSLTAVNDRIDALDTGRSRQLDEITWAYAALARHAPVFTCLMLGFSARALLRRRGLASVIVLGVDRKKTGNTSALNAHAWVVYQKRDISGGEQKKDYTAVAAYSID